MEKLSTELLKRPYFLKESTGQRSGLLALSYLPLSVTLFCFSFEVLTGVLFSSELVYTTFYGQFSRQYLRLNYRHWHQPAVRHLLQKVFNGFDYVN